MSKTYVGDIGTIIRIDMGAAITGAAGLTIAVKKPDATTTSWTPSIYGTNYLEYTLIAADIAQAGIYYLQPYLELGGFLGKGETVNFTVYAAFG